MKTHVQYRAVFAFKNPHVSGPTQFKPVLFKGQQSPSCTLDPQSLFILKPSDKHLISPLLQPLAGTDLLTVATEFGLFRLYI